MKEERYDISAEDSEAFRRALWAYDYWIWDRERLVEVPVRGNRGSVDVVCDIVEKFNGTMPDDHYSFLCESAAVHTGGTVMAPADHSYTAGAKCLRSLIAYQRRLKQMRADAR